MVTTHNPDSGATDAKVLHALTRLRGNHDMTLGAWCEIPQPGYVHLDDPVTLN